MSRNKGQSFTLAFPLIFMTFTGFYIEFCCKRAQQIVRLSNAIKEHPLLNGFICNTSTFLY